VKLIPGGTTRVRVTTPGTAFLDRYTLELNNPPAGVTLTEVAAIPGGLELVFAGDPDTLAPGAAGNLICDIMAKPQAAAPPVVAAPAPANGTNAAKPAVPAKPPVKRAANPARRPAVATLPAIPYTVPVE
jgi:hypothetical protein